MLSVTKLLQAMDTEREDSLSACNWMHYPDVSHREVPAGQLRLHPHADNDILTLLFQRTGEDYVTWDPSICQAIVSCSLEATPPC